MDQVTIIDLKRTILEDNDADAELLRREMKADKTFYINVMSSPGSGKTTTLLGLLKRLTAKGLRCGVMEADIDSDVDAIKIQNAGFRAIQLHTGGMCHLDADMSRQGLRAIDTSNLDVVFLENVGNLVCPAEFETGSAWNLVILSVPEGEDKPLKYPLMFQKANAVLINKIDAMPVFDYSLEKVTENVHLRNADIQVFPVASIREEGLDPVADLIAEEAGKWLAN